MNIFHLFDDLIQCRWTCFGVSTLSKAVEAKEGGWVWEPCVPGCGKDRCLHFRERSGGWAVVPIWLRVWTVTQKPFVSTEKTHPGNLPDTHFFVSWILHGIRCTCGTFVGGEAGRWCWSRIEGSSVLKEDCWWCTPGSCWDSASQSVAPGQHHHHLGTFYPSRFPGHSPNLSQKC